MNCFFLSFAWGFSGGSEGKGSAWNAGDLGLIPGSGRSPGEGNGNPLSVLAWRIPGTGSLVGCCLWVAQSWTQLKRLSSSSSSRRETNTFTLSFAYLFYEVIHFSYLFAEILTSWTWILVVLYTSYIVLADVIIFVAPLGRCRCRPPWFQDGQCSDKTVKVEDGGWWKERVCPQPPLMVKAVTDALRKKQATWRRNDCLPLPTMPFGTSLLWSWLFYKRGEICFL